MRRGVALSLSASGSGVELECVIILNQLYICRVFIICRDLLPLLLFLLLLLLPLLFVVVVVSCYYCCCCHYCCCCYLLFVVIIIICFRTDFIPSRLAGGLPSQSSAQVVALPAHHHTATTQTVDVRSQGRQFEENVDTNVVILSVECKWFQQYTSYAYLYSILYVILRL